MKTLKLLSSYSGELLQYADKNGNVDTSIKALESNNYRMGTYYNKREDNLVAYIVTMRNKTITYGRKASDYRLVGFIE